MNTLLKIEGGAVAVAVTDQKAFTVYVAAKTVMFFKDAEWTD